MRRQERIEAERLSIATALATYPTLLLEGPASTAVLRTMEAVGSLHHLSEMDLKLIHGGAHPDWTVMDGSDTNPESARDIRDRVTAQPARLPRRYLILSRIDRLHQNATQALLKITEEPPQHLRIVMTTDRPWAIIQTIYSRSIQYTIEPPTYEELEQELRLAQIEEPQWRAAASGRNPDVARELDVKLTKEWHKTWATCLGGSSPSPDLPHIWSERFAEFTEGTAISCWCILIALAAKQPKNIYWRDIALWSIRERERWLRGRSNKIRTSTALVHVYAYAKTAAKRRSS